MYAQALCPQNELLSVSPNVYQTRANAGEHKQERNENHCSPYGYGVRLEIEMFHVAAPCHLTGWLDYGYPNERGC